MTIPSLSIRIKKNSLKEILQVLQGISRYITAIYISSDILNSQSLEIIDGLILRYPKKEIFLEIEYKRRNLDTFLNVLFDKTNLQNFAIIFYDNDTPTASAKNLRDLFIKNKKNYLFLVNSRNFTTFINLDLQNIGYFKKPAGSGKIKWTAKDKKNLEKLQSKKTSLKIVDLDNEGLKIFCGCDLKIQELIMGPEITLSFNPIDSCKRIYLNIKKHYLK